MLKILGLSVLLWLPSNALAATVDCLKIEWKEDIQLAMYNDKPFTGECTFRYESGQKWEEYNYKEGKKHGTQTRWYANGQKWYEYNYKEGDLHGTQTVWYESGQKKEEEN